METLFTNRMIAAYRLWPAKLYRGTGNLANPTVARQSYGNVFARGLAWAGLQSISTKLFSVLGQIVLAWLLDPKDFGIVASALAISTFPSLLSQIGIREVIVRRAARLHLWSSPALWMALAFGVMSAVATLASIPIASYLYARHDATSVPVSDHRQQLALLLVVLAVSQPANTVANVYYAQLQAQLRFRAMAILGFGQAAGTTGLSILFAWLGFGALSFVLPITVIAIARLVVLILLAPVRVNRKPRFRRWRYLIGDSGYLLLARAFGTFIVVGDYLVLGYLYDEQTLGTYYFAFNLSMQTVLVLVANLDGVLFGTLVKMKNDLVRQKEGFLKAARTLSLFGIPICFLQAGLAQPGIEAVFAAKWLPAVPAVQILSIGMALRLVGWASQSLIMAQGRFKLYAIIYGIASAAFMAFVFAGAMFNRAPAVAVSIAVAAYFVIEGPVLLRIATGPAGGTWRDVGKVYFGPVLTGAIAVGTAMGVNHRLGLTGFGPWSQLFIGATVAIAVYVPLVGWFEPELVATVRERLRLLRTGN